VETEGRGRQDLSLSPTLPSALRPLNSISLLTRDIIPSQQSRHGRPPNASGSDEQTGDMLTRCRPARSPALRHTALPDGAKRDNKGATQEEEEGAEHVHPIRSEKG
jgi:hypothetical protein